MNKWSRIAVLGSLSVLMVAGCGTSSTTIPDASESLFTVGDTTVTKGDTYQSLKIAYGPGIAIDEVNKQIYEKEVPVDDEIKQSAQSTLDMYKQMTGFAEQLEANGYASEQDYLDQILIPGVQAQELRKKYFTEAKDEIIADFDPVLAVIIQTDSEDNANKALDALKEGVDAGKVGAQYASADATYTGLEQIITTKTTDLPDALHNAILDAGKDGVLDQVFTNDTSTDDKVYYVASVVSTDYDANLSKIQSALASDTQITSDVQVFYLKKYGFEVHDQYIFDYLKAMTPQYLVTRPDLSESSES